MPRRLARRPHAEFMQVWEEGYVGTTETFVAMHMQGVAVLDGGTLRREDGSLDERAITAWVESATRGVPYAHLRLQRSFLGLTPPAWVPADLRIDDHVRFGTETALTDDNLRTLIGWEEGPLESGKPLWRLQITPLTDGRVALGILMHHAGGDALRTLTFLRALTTSKADAAPDLGEPLFPDERAAGAIELPLLAWATWWRASADMRGRGRAYLRKPVVRRARRVAARITRRLRDRPARAVTTHSGHRTLDASNVQEMATQLDGTMNDLVVAAAIHAGAVEGGPVRVRVPVLRKPTEGSRNRVADAAIHGDRAGSSADLVTTVKRQLADARAGTPRRPETAREIGYATLVPWISRTRFVLGAAVDEVIVLPASLPHDELSMFAIFYDGRLTVTATTQQSTPLPPLLDTLATFLTTPPAASGR